ncbi:MAG: CvpA family protein, partial [Bacteroidota bacterium]
MKLLDLLTLILLLLGGVSGFRRGLIVEAFSIGALLIAACISAALLDTLLAWCNVPGQQDWENWLPYIAFGGVFVVLVVLITLLGRCMKRLVKPTLLGSLDRLLGCLIGMLKWGTF